MIGEVYPNSISMQDSGDLWQDTMDEDSGEEGNLTSAGSGREFLAPSKSFTKKKVTAAASIVGTVHSSPVASFAHNKSGDFVDSQGGHPGSSLFATETACEVSKTDYSITKFGGWAFPEEVAEVAALAQACRLTCKASQEGLQASCASGASIGAKDGASYICKTDLTCLSLGTGNKYIKGAFVHIALHLGLGNSREQSTHG